MSDKQQQYKVVADGHIHAGAALKKGDIVTLRPRVAERFPDVFQPVSTASARVAVTKE